MKLKDQVAIVTGGARGNGLAIAKALAGEGCHIVLADICEDIPTVPYGLSTRETLDRAVEEIQAMGVNALGVVCDVRSDASVRALVDEVKQKFGRIDILVNNAGITRDALLLRMKEEDWRKVIATNLDGVFLVTKEVLPRMMKQRYGRVINISSVVGLMGNAGQGNYAASKAGVIGFTKAVAREVASRNITVNAVAPGYVDTAMTQQLSEAARAALLQLVPMGRMGTVDDIAAGVLFLASEEAGYITGHVLNINGGMYM